MPLPQDLGGECGFVLGKEAPIVLLDHVRGVLDRIAHLLVGSGQLEDVGGQHVPDIMGAVWQQALDRPAASIGIVDPVSLNGEPPGFIEGGLVVRGFSARLLDRLYKESAGSLASASRMRRCRSM